ncbi:MAG: hypothetical protein O2945_12020 [Planctomycetota bacterium]|nr:hypothetical protein [Planctomycetota bacterium]
MAFEVACSECEGRLMVEEAGVVVACPHCGAHLNIEAPADSETASTDDAANTFDEQPNDGPNESPETVVEQPAEELPAPDSSTATPLETVEQETPAPTTLNEDGDALRTEDSATVEEPGSVSVNETTPAEEASAPLFAVAPDEVQQPEAEFTASVTQPEHPATAETQPASGSVEAPIIASVAAGRGVSRHTFTLVRNYAIAMTIAVVFLVYKLLNPNMSALESLPDVKPPKKDDKIVYKLVPEATQMPPGHRLSLGQSQRFGNLQVTPVRITKEPVEFVHHLGETGVSRDPGSDVIKLWFEFENLSTDQSIAPLDGLVFKRDDNDFENVRSNNFACRLSEKKKGGKLAFVYDLNEFDIWNLRDQHVDQEIAPGEKLTTYIPTTEEGVAQLMNSDEPLVWRVHFRKGYSPKNYGVTTVIEVAFESSDIGAPKAAEPAVENAA